MAEKLKSNKSLLRTMQKCISIAQSNRGCIYWIKEGVNKIDNYFLYYNVFLIRKYGQ